MKIDELIGFKNKPEYKLFKSPPTDYTVNSITPTKVGELRAIAKKLDDLGYKQYSIGTGFYSQVYARPQDNFVIKIFREDKGYSTFLQYITQNSNNPYVPKLKGKIIKLPNDYYVIRLEKLKRMDNDLFKKIEWAANNDHDKPLIQELNDKYPGLLEFVRSLRQMSYDNKVMYDLHGGNMMMRGDTPVVTDPFAD